MAPSMLGGGRFPRQGGEKEGPAAGRTSRRRAKGGFMILGSAVGRQRFGGQLWGPKGGKRNALSRSSLWRAPPASRGVDRERPPSPEGQRPKMSPGGERRILPKGNEVPRLSPSARRGAQSKRQEGGRWGSRNNSPMAVACAEKTGLRLRPGGRRYSTLLEQPRAGHSPLTA